VPPPKGAARSPGPPGRLLLRH